PGRRVLDVVEQLARVVDFRARRGVDLYEVDEAPVINFAAGAADTTWRRRHPGLAIQRLREDACDGRLADAAGAGEQERVVQAVVVERIDQGPQHMLLADHGR